MITALSIKIPKKKKGFCALADRFKGDRAEAEVKTAGSVTVRHIIYTSYSGELKLERLNAIVGAERCRLLCSDRLIFPRQSGYRRFCSTAFSSRLCTNFALGVLKSVKNAADLRVAIYDPAAYCADFLLSVLEYCADVTVVTSCFEPYLCVLDRALCELGATAMVTKNRAELERSDLVIAPQPISEEIKLKNSAVLLAVSPPPKDIKCKAFYKYHFKMPNTFAKLKPFDLSEEYFCSALYTIGGQHQFGSILPLSAEGSCGVRSISEFTQLLLDNGK